MPSGGIRQDIDGNDRLFTLETRDIQWDVTDDGTTTGTPTAMTGWTIALRIFQKRGGTQLLNVTPTIGNGAATDDRATWTWLPANSTTVGGAGKWYYHLERLDSGSEATLAYGDFILHAETAVA